jgi:hypothetical protein
LEGEACGSDTNGGCNSTPNVFTPVACGNTYCGTGWADGNTRDTDWYKLVITSPTTVTWSGIAEFPLLVGVVNNFGVDSCAGVSSFLVFGTAPANGTASASTTLNPGTWYLFVANSGFNGNPCDGVNNDYTVSLTCP